MAKCHQDVGMNKGLETLRSNNWQYWQTNCIWDLYLELSNRLLQVWQGVSEPRCVRSRCLKLRSVGRGKEQILPKHILQRRHHFICFQGQILMCNTVKHCI